MSSSEESELDSDAELQEAFAKGILKPGLNVVSEATPKKSHTNDVEGLKEKYNEIYLDLNWIERLDIVNDPAPLAPEMAVEIQEQEVIRTNQLQNVRKGEPVVALEEDPVMNDFKREMLFHRQAQGAVFEGISRLKELGIPSKRPDDYFAEMAKSDEHMQRVRKRLLRHQKVKEMSEKAKQHRQIKKLAKQQNKEAKLRKVEEKREMLAEVKKYRKGLRKDLDFLDDNKNKKNKGKDDTRKPESNKEKKKREYKENTYGYGGKKKGSKRNTSESAADVSELDTNRKNRRGKGGANKNAKPEKTSKFTFKKGRSKPLRPGKRLPFRQSY